MDPTEFRQRFADWKAGKKVYDAGKPIEDDYEKFKQTLSPNQKNASEYEYSTRRYWELKGKPKNFDDAVKMGMYSLEDDGHWHARSIAWTPEGDAEFMKPNVHPTKHFEDEFYESNPEFQKKYRRTFDWTRPGFSKYERNISPLDHINLPKYDGGETPGPKEDKTGFDLYVRLPESGEIWRDHFSNIDDAVEDSERFRKRGYPTPLNMCPEVVVTGYRPIELQTYYPLGKKYPFTGHSALKIPITDYVAEEYEIEPESSLYVDKLSDAKDYNLVTNNCADATLGYLNHMFGTDENPLLFTTPGDVRDYAITQLGGKVVNKNGTDTVLIPRNSTNADELSRKALDFKGEKQARGTSYLITGHDNGKSIKPLPKYDGGMDDKTYLPEYEYEATVTPQGVSLEKHKRITNEEDWQKYWGNVGAGYVNKAQEAAAPVVLNGMSMLMGNPVGALAGILGSEVGSELGAKISPQASAIGGLVGGIALDPANIKSAIKYTQKAVPRVMAQSARKASALAYQFFPNKTSKFYDRLLNNVNIGNEIKPLYTDIDVTDSRYIGKGQMHVVVQNPDDINSVLKFGTDPMSKIQLQRRILSLNRTNGFEYLEPEQYLGYMQDPTNSESFYEVLKQDKVIPKDKTEIFNPDTKKMKSLKELFSADKEQYKILERIKEIAKRSGADKSVFDGNYITHNGSVIQDFGHRHNIGYNQKGSPVIFDPAISTPKHVELVDMVFPWLIGHDSGKSIHINPANKGKFNATKKRTGKTTEQLAHSKNPLTRKRAIFALNARKWKH